MLIAVVVVVIVGAAMDVIWWVSESTVENRAGRERMKATTSTGRTGKGKKAIYIPVGNIGDRWDGISYLLLEIGKHVVFFLCWSGNPGNPLLL